MRNTLIWLQSVCFTKDGRDVGTSAQFVAGVVGRERFLRETRSFGCIVSVFTEG